MKKYIATVELAFYAGSDECALKEAQKIVRSLENRDIMSFVELTELKETKHYGFNNRNINFRSAQESKVKKAFKEEFIQNTKGY